LFIIALEGNMKDNPEVQVGGQAVIEGVMMRSQDAYSVAVRRQDGSIYVRVQPFISLIKKNRFFSLPLIRGAVVLIESLVLGVKSLTFSGDIAVEDEKRKDGTAAVGDSPVPQRTLLSNLWLMVTVAFSFIFGMFLFFYLPLLITEWLGAESGVMFNLIDGLVRMAIFLLYIGLIAMMKDVKRIFEYHGAEHKSIFAFENKLTLQPDFAMAMSRFHPRCGTSFLLFVMLVSVAVFMFLGKPDTVSERLIRLAFIPLIGGLSYELIRFSGKHPDNMFWRPFILPGLWLQKLTTKEPDASQLEVALVALKCALKLDCSMHDNVVIEGEELAKIKTA